MAEASKNLTPVALELGGETGNWCLVRKDADLRDAARKIAFFIDRRGDELGILFILFRMLSDLADKFFAQDMEKLINLAKTLDNINFRGLHFHIGSQILEMDDFVALSNRINELQDKLDESGLSIEIINVGGGLGIDYDDPMGNPIPNFADYFATYNKYLKLRPGQSVHFELGRSVVGQCGALITKVNYVKEGSVKKFAIVDAGMTDLIRPALYDAHHKTINLSSSEAEETYDVVGPICESSDVFDKGIKLAKTKRGDLIAMLSAGAYGEIMASGYNCRKLPVGYTSDELY